MKRKATFCCDASRDMYEDYYTNQSGQGTPVFVGAKYQRGHGLGSILNGLFRRIVLPFLRANGRTIASKAINTGLEIADDVAQGKSLKESAKRRISKGIKEAAQKKTGRRVPERRRVNVVVFLVIVVVITTTSLHENGLCSRAVVRMSQVGAGPVFSAADADQRGEWQLDRISSVIVGRRQFAHRNRD